MLHFHWGPRVVNCCVPSEFCGACVEEQRSVASVRVTVSDFLLPSQPTHVASLALLTFSGAFL